MKIGLQILFWIISIVLGYLIYDSINAPLKFDKIKVDRYTKVIDRLKDIREAQLAHKTVTGKFANDFNGLIKFIDTAQFTLTQKRDSSFMRYDKTYRIDMVKDTVIIDTLGFAKIKDSLFKNSDRYKDLQTVPTAPNKEKFEIKSMVLDKSGYKVPVFEVKVDKQVVLYDQPKYLIRQEKAANNVDAVRGTHIILGSLEDVSTNGNWPTIYDTKTDQ